MSKTNSGGKFGFNVEFNNVTRDFSQGFYGNRIPLNHEEVLKTYALWNNELVSTNDPEKAFTFGSIEVGGAQPQVDVVFGNRDWTQTIKDIRTNAPESTIRPLWRGANAFMLKPNHIDELRWILNQLAEDTAKKDSPSRNQEMLRVKAFDSQGVIREIESTVKMISELRSEGYPIGVEVAIPYSNGEVLEPNPYPDEFYVQKIVAAAKLAEKYGIPQDVFRVSLKDMVGELDAKTAERLVGKIIDGLEGAGLKIKLGLHLHDTGLATEAYAAAIAVCHKRNWPVAVDTVEGHDTGFANTTALYALLKEKYQVDLGLDEKQLLALEQMGQVTDEVAKSFQLRRTEGKLLGDELRKFKIPGGGLASFEDAVARAKIAASLGISQEDAVRVAGYALIAVGHVMGEPFAVTPGFQNKQIAALNFLKNMLEAGILHKGMKLDEIYEAVLTPLQSEQVEPLFLKGLDNVVRDFLKGDMPVAVHPVIHEELGHRARLLTDGLESNLTVLQKMVRRLQEEGHIAQGEEAFKSAVSWAIVVGNPEVFRQNILKPWLREPDPSHYTSKDEYNRALKKFQKGLNPEPDNVERIRQYFLNGSIDSTTAKAYMEKMLLVEQDAIKDMVDEFLSRHQENVIRAREAISQEEKEGVADLVKAVYGLQKYLIGKKLEQGEEFLYPEEERINIALDYVAQLLVKGQEQFLPQVKEIFSEVKAEIESSMLASPMPGKIVKLHVEVKKGELLEVQKGQDLIIMEAMKMQTVIRAPESGKISSIMVKEGDVVSARQVLITFQRERGVEKSSGMEISEQSYQDIRIVEENLVIPVPEVTSETQPSQGYHVRKLNQGEQVSRGSEQFIHIVGNRAGCAVKIMGDLEQLGHDVCVLYTDGDKTTPIIKYAENGKAIKINSYTDQTEIIETLKKVAEQNQNKTILFHPGWGFLSEKDDFVARIENELKGYKIIFSGPPSEPMQIAGGKKTFRDLVSKAAPECNPGYFGNDLVSAKDLQRYIDSGFSQEDPLDATYRKYFQQVKEMGGDVMIKAVAGGGGRGIKNFKYDSEISDEENYQHYIRCMAENVSISETLFHDGQMLTEQCVRGNTHHIEVQFAATNGKAVTLGLRNCSAQNDGQKFAEINVIEGDYSPRLISMINKAALSVAEKLAEIGYKGLGTLEMLVLPESTTGQEVVFLEVNTRIQVEHAVTEEDITLKTGKSISLPVLNMHLTANNGTETPGSILEDVFGFTQDDLVKLDSPAKERITHFRIVSKDMNLVKGVAIPTWFGDDKWPTHIDSSIAKEFGVSIIHGGLGDGNYDPQIGAIFGKEDDVIRATERLLEIFRLSQLFDRTPDKTNLETVLTLYPLMFDENGKVSRAFSTRTTDELLKGVKSGTLQSVEKQGQGHLWPGEQHLDSKVIAMHIEELSHSFPGKGSWQDKVGRNGQRSISPESIRKQQEQKKQQQTENSVV